MANDDLKDEYTNTTLTQALEGIARETNRNLKDLAKEKGKDDFLLHQGRFTALIRLLSKLAV